MCFYDQHRYACGDWKWGHFRQHCNKEYRTGETCGMKFVRDTWPIAAKCKLCEKVDTKLRRRAAEIDRVERWRRDGSRFTASIDKSMDMIKTLESEIMTLQQERTRRLQGVGSGR